MSAKDFIIKVLVSVSYIADGNGKKEDRSRGLVIISPSSFYPILNRMLKMSAKQTFTPDNIVNKNTNIFFIGLDVFCLLAKLFNIMYISSKSNSQ